MTNAWDEMKAAKEDAYFEKLNKESLIRLNARDGEKTRLSPITGEPMEHVTIHGIVVDRCPKSGYIGLDAGELEEMIKVAKSEEHSKSWLDKFLTTVKGK